MWGGALLSFVFYVDMMLDSKYTSNFDVNRIFQISIAIRMIQIVYLNFTYQRLISLLFLTSDSKFMSNFNVDRMFQVLISTCGLSDTETRKWGGGYARWMQ